MIKENPLDVIKSVAEGLGMVLNDPKPSCKKCYGRGYTGIKSDTGEPIACNCILPKYNNSREVGELFFKPLNREQRRRQKKIDSKKSINKKKRW